MSEKQYRPINELYKKQPAPTRKGRRRIPWHEMDRLLKEIRTTKEIPSNDKDDLLT